VTTSARAKLAGVIGDPIEHSLSPLIHAHWLNAYAIDGAYVPLRVARDQFSRAIEGLRIAGFVGVNVTLPHKEAAFAIADRHDAFARATKAANLLMFRESRIEAHNTDVEGLQASLAKEAGVLENTISVVLGAGGAARAAVLALARLGVEEIRVVARNPARGAGLKADLESSVQAKLQVFGWKEWPRAASSATLVVNTTSAGMRGNPPLDLPVDPLPRTAFVCDIVYNPLETAFLKTARRRGHTTIDGLGMLMHQAAPAFAAFFGVMPAVTPALRAELEEVLGGKD